MDLAVPLEYANSGKPFCPPEYPHFLGGVSDGEGGVRSQRRFGSPEPLKFQHIPRIGYVSLFPLLLKVTTPAVHERLSHPITRAHPGPLFSCCRCCRWAARGWTASST